MTVLTIDSVASFLDVGVVHVQSGPNAQPRAKVRVAKTALSQVAPDWNADVELLTVDDGTSTLMLRGTVYSAIQVDPDTVELDIRSWPDVLEDIGTPGILVRDAPRADIAWSVIMTAGVEADSLSVEGQSDLPVEEFRVIVPIYGLVIDQPINIEKVRLLPSPGMPPMEVPPEFSYLAEPFWACRGIAIAHVSARTLFEAEQQGLAEVDYALGVALLDRRAAYLDPHEPTFSTYSRERTLAILGRYPVVAVLGRWGRRWLRGTREGRPDEGGTLTLELDPSWLPALRDVPQPLRQAIASWRRAVEEVDRVPKLLALWECLEFYAAGTKLPRLFKPSEVAQLRERAEADLNPDQLERIEELIAGLNSPPLMVKLEHAAGKDGVVLSVADRAVLRRLRDARNDISHGRKWTVPAHSDLRKGIGIANRLLVSRLKDTTPARASQGNTGRDTADPPGTSRDEVAGIEPSRTFAQNDNQWAEQAAEAMMLMMPYLERGELVPGPVRSRIQGLYADATEESLVVGVMRACDVAVKHLSRHFFDGALDHAAATVRATLATIKSEDLAGLGSEAYEDGARALQLMTEAMIRHGTANFLEELRTSKRLLLAFNAVLIALLFELAERYGISPARAAAHLGQEISTITPMEH